MHGGRVVLLLALLCLAAVGAGAADADADASEIATAEGAGNPAQPLAAAPESEDAQRAKAQLKATGGAPVPGPAAAGNAGGGDLGINADYVMIGAGVVGTLCCMAGGWFLLNQGGPKKRKFRGDAVFLVGPCDSGKTAVMFQLRDGESGGKLRPTHTSMALNEETFALSGIDCKPVRVIDFPGHSRLRPQLFDMIEDCRVLIFVVDCSTFASKAREVGSFLLDLLTSEKLLKNCGNMLIVCNKIDALPDELAGISPKTMVKKRLETEIEALRRARAEGLDDIANSMRVELEIAGSVFKWTDAPVEIEFADGSARDGKLDPVKKFIAQNAGG